MRKFILVFLLLFLIVVLAAQTQFDISLLILLNMDGRTGEIVFVIVKI